MLLTSLGVQEVVSTGASFDDRACLPCIAALLDAGTAAWLSRPGDLRQADRARPAAVSVQIDLRASEESDEDRGAPFHTSSIHYAYVRSRVGAQATLPPKWVPTAPAPAPHCTPFTMLPQPPRRLPRRRCAPLARSWSSRL
jgi:hypothetical protein